MLIQDRLWLPVDVSTLEDAKKLVGSLIPAGVLNFKIGLEFTTAVGSVAAVRCIKSLGGKVWYDGKFCDIPNTIAGASRAVAKLGVEMFNVHASSGLEAMRAAVKHKGSSRVLVVTILTSLSNINLWELGYSSSWPGASLIGDEEFEKQQLEYIGKVVIKMSLCAASALADGIICSPKELELLWREPGLGHLAKITPGVRPTWAATNDQKRVMTPAEAITAGATSLVIGRPITDPPKEIGTPADAVKRIYDEIASVL